MTIARTTVRLACVQSCWSYDRMQGIGIGYASLPLLAPLGASDPDRYRAAVARASTFFNANPYLAGIVVAAAARAELDGAAGEHVLRLKKALAGPLGALGDLLFWAGLVPLVSAILLVAGAGWGVREPAIAGWVIGLTLVLFNGFRFGLARWSVGFGWRHGLSTGGALVESGLPRVGPRIAPLAAVLGGVAIPMTLAAIGGQGRTVSVLVLAVIGLAGLARRRSWRLPPTALTVVGIVGVGLWRWVVAGAGT